jgi:hypothetical protein
VRSFKLERQPRGQTSTRFHVLDGANSTIGIITVPNEAAADLEKHWKGVPPSSAKNAAAAKQDPMIATMVAAVRKRGARVNRAAILRGC